MTGGRRIEVEVAVAWPSRQRLVRVVLGEGATVADALAAAAPLLGEDAPDAAAPVGVWGAPVARDRGLEAGDRVEVYRPLPVDPKDRRRRLAREGRTMGKSPGRPGVS